MMPRGTVFRRVILFLLAVFYIGKAHFLNLQTKAYIKGLTNPSPCQGKNAQGEAMGENKADSPIAGMRICRAILLV